MISLVSQLRGLAISVDYYFLFHKNLFLVITTVVSVLFTLEQTDSVEVSGCLRDIAGNFRETQIWTRGFSSN